jgi:hypothetical protein
LVLGALVYSGYYIPHYFDSFAKLPADPFRRDIREAIDNRGDRGALDVVGPWLDQYGGEEELRYYLIRWDHYDCRSSATALQQLRERLNAEKSSRRRKR